MSSPTPSSTGGKKPAGKLAFNFVKKYYGFLTSTPEKIDVFYKGDESIMSQGEGISRVNSALYRDCKEKSLQRWFSTYNNGENADDFDSLRFDLAVGSIDAQYTKGDDVIVVVTAAVTLVPKGDSNSQAVTKTFAHTFFLVRDSPKTPFYVKNDILRFIYEPAPATPAVTATESNDVGVGPDAATTADAATGTTEEPEKLPVVMDVKPVDVPVVHEPVPADDDVSPGGGVEETKEIMPDDDDDDEDEPPVEDAAPVVGPEPEEIPSDAVPADEPPAPAPAPKSQKSNGNKSKRQGRGNNRGQQQQQAPAKPNSWASLVASGKGNAVGTPASGSTAGSPAKTAPVAENPVVVEDASEAKPPAADPTATAAQQPKAEAANGSNGFTERNAGSKSASGGGKNASGRDSRGAGGNKAPRDPESTLVIKNLPDQTVQATVVALFEKFATKVNAKIVGSNVSSQRSIAFVDFDSSEPVLAAIEAHKTEPFQINGRTLEVEQKTSEGRPRRRGYQGGGGGERGNGGGGGYRERNGGGGNRNQQYRRSNSGRGGRGRGGGGGGGGGNSDGGGSGGGGK